MKIKFLIILLLLFTTNITTAQAVIKDEEIYSAFQEILDRDPEMGEYHLYIRGYKGKDYVKKSLNALEERQGMIKNIYQQALKRNPRADELETLVRYVAPNNLIRTQLYESRERKLAIVDAYQNFLDRDPADSDLAFYVKTRSPFEKIKEVLNLSTERKIVLNKFYNNKFQKEINPTEVKYVIDNRISLSNIDSVSVLGIEHVEVDDGVVDIVWFNDFECSYCSEFSKTIKKVEDFFGSEVAIEMRHFPLPFHKQSMIASIYYECAKAQNFEDQMAETIYASRLAEEMSSEYWDTSLTTIEYNDEEFYNCVKSEKTKIKIEEDIKYAQENRVYGTPTIIVEGEVLLGAQTFDELADTIIKYKK